MQSVIIVITRRIGARVVFYKRFSRRALAFGDRSDVYALIWRSLVINFSLELFDSI